MKLDILFRSCTRVNALHGFERPLGVTKSDVTLTCLESIIKSREDNKEIVIHVLDDHSLEEDIVKMKDLLRERDKFIKLEKTGNGNSMEANFNYARDNNFEVIYFCEDDYLHTLPALAMLKDFYESWLLKFNRECILTPDDSLTTHTKIYPPSKIWLGKDRHWREIFNTAVTFLLGKGILNKYWDSYMELVKWNKISAGHEGTFCHIYKGKEICLAPLPALACHFSPSPSLPLYVDWEALFLNTQKGMN